jgi:hypothetical protein
MTFKPLALAVLVALTAPVLRSDLRDARAGG